MSEEQNNGGQSSSENTAQTQSATTQTQPTEASIETNRTETSNTNEGSGYERVEFSPEQQKRFDNLYGQVKAQDRKFNEALDVMRQQSDTIAQLQQGVGNVVNHLNTQSNNTSEEAARNEADAAFARGDSRGYLKAMEKVAQLSAAKIVQQSLNQQQQQQRQQQQKPGNEVARAATNNGHLNAADVPAFEAWQDERDASGNPVRPWAKRETGGDHFESALLRSAGVFADPKFRNAPIEQKLEEVDRIMGVTKQSPQQNVMGSNLTTKGKPNNIKISADMEKVLNHLKPRGSKAKNAPDPVAWYREQAVKANKGVRR